MVQVTLVKEDPLKKESEEPSQLSKSQSTQSTGTQSPAQNVLPPLGSPSRSHHSPVKNHHSHPPPVSTTNKGRFQVTTIKEDSIMASIPEIPLPDQKGHAVGVQCDPPIINEV